MGVRLKRGEPADLPMNASTRASGSDRKGGKGSGDLKLRH